MLKLLRSRRLGSFVAVAIGFFGFCLGCRRMTVINTSPTATAGQMQIAFLDSVLDLIGFGLIGLVGGLVLTAIQHALETLNRADEWRAREADCWERLLHRLETNVPSGRDESMERTPVSTHNESAEEIDRAIQAGDWKRADGLLETLRAGEPSNPELARLARLAEAGRNASIESNLGRIRASKEVGDTERVLELYQDIARVLDPSVRKPLEGDLARWFMNQIQHRLRSGMIQPEVVTLSARVSEVFGETVEGASLRAGLPTLRRSVGLCPRCQEPYRGVDEACPACLQIAPA